MSSFSGVTYGDISPRVGIYAVASFLTHAQPILVLERFGSFQPVPKNVGQLMKWRRAIPFEVSMDKLVEGVTPPPQGISFEDVSTTLSQYGS